MSTRHEYERDPAAIYRQSFAIIRREANLARFSGVAERVVVRMIHTSGSVDLSDEVALSPDFASAARAALRAGAPILCDANMIVSGVTRARLPAHNEVCCALGDPAVFYDAVGDPERLRRNQERMFRAVQQFIALDRIESHPMSEYDFS